MARHLQLFVYGADMHPVVFGISAPGCRFLGIASLARHSLRFHKRSGDPGDPSGKCDAYYTGRIGDAVHGIVFQIHERFRPQIEEGWADGCGYRPVSVHVSIGPDNLEVQARVADPDWIDARLLPFDWYVALIGSGARIHGLPAAYQTRLRKVRSVSDPDTRRSARNFDIARGTAKIRPFFRRPRV